MYTVPIVSRGNISKEGDGRKKRSRIQQAQEKLEKKMGGSLSSIAMRQNFGFEMKEARGNSTGVQVTMCHGLLLSLSVQSHFELSDILTHSIIPQALMSLEGIEGG